MVLGIAGFVAASYFMGLAFSGKPIPMLLIWEADACFSVEPYNTFDGPSFSACNSVSQVYRPATVDAIVKDASQRGVPVRASGVSSC
jgi:hypothetical protein